MSTRLIGCALSACDIASTPISRTRASPPRPRIGAATGLPAAEAVRLLSRRQCREGDVADLQSVTSRLGLEVPLQGLGLLAEPERAP